MDLVWETAPRLVARKYGDLQGARGGIILRTFLLQPYPLDKRRKCAALGIICTANRAYDHEAKRAVPIRTLHKSGVDKGQTPYPGEEQVDLTRFLENFVKFLYGTLGSIYDSRR
jgi:hypothetical protein